MTNCLGVVGNEYGVYATKRTSYMDVLSKRYSVKLEISFRLLVVLMKYLKNI